MTTVLIAAHNEEGVLGACLDAVRDEIDASSLQIIVIANGCTDGTAGVARGRPGVTVVELDQGSKPLALNAGETLATSFPRVYLDADIVAPRGAIKALAGAVDAMGILAAVPDRELVVVGRPWPVQAYYTINERLPAFTKGLFGRGVIALSAEGRARFDQFPIMVADDLFLDSLFADEEKAHVSTVRVKVEVPFTTRDLINRLARVRRGNAAMRRAGASGNVNAQVRPADRWSWIRDVVIRDLRLVPAGVAYAAITILAAAQARRGPASAMAWGRDASSRRPGES
jgi:glycosyltransferase involved in cell wall biosynthesis